MAKYETTKPCRLIDPNDTGEEFIWPEYENKDPTLAQDAAPISDFARELRDRVCQFGFHHVCCVTRSTLRLFKPRPC
jgi:hypothetical protein